MKGLFAVNIYTKRRFSMHIASHMHTKRMQNAHAFRAFPVRGRSVGRQGVSHHELLKTGLF